MYLYHLAAGEGPAIDAVLENAIVILDPLFNPDGRDRFTDWANRNRGGVHTTDPQDREHLEAWPGGRTNHYLFDLNRDWLPAQHPESQGRLEVFHQWRPVVLTDHHEMGTNSTFFFMPGIPSRNNPYTPERNFELTAALAEYHGEYLDRIGSLYYSRESFDDYYSGKGSTYPDATGAIGILFEQGSSRALERESINGALHYSTTVQNQFATSLSTIAGAVALKTELLGYHRDFYATSGDVYRDSDNKAFIVSLAHDRTRAQALAQMLQRHRIELHTLARDYSAGGQTFAAGDAYVVPVNQSQARLVKAAFERFTTFPDSLFYDVSTWTMPLAFGLDYAEVTSNPNNLIGDAMGPVELDGGTRAGGVSEYGYLMEWDRYFAPSALYDLQEAGLFPRVLHKEVEARVAGTVRSFPRGTIMIPAVPRDRSVGLSIEDVSKLVDGVVANHHVNVYAVESGLAASGVDLGSPSASVLQQPKIALITGSGTSAYNIGEVWHLLSERYRIPVSLLDADRIDRADLSRYTTIVMAGGFYGDVDGASVTDWVRGGGHLITVSSATDWAIRNDMWDLEEHELDMDSLLSDMPFDQLGTARGAQFIGGSIFEAELDSTHPLAYGFNSRIPVFRNSTSLYAPPETPGQTVGVYTDDPLLSGYISEERLELVPGSAALVAKRMGQGRVVSFMDNPNFRAFWYGTSRLFMNAVFFSGTF